jgi:hypothetical protein
MRQSGRKLTSLSLAIVFTLILAIAGCTDQPPLIQPGDIVFQKAVSPQSEAIRLATGSEFTHCGVVLKGPDNSLVVYEAIQPVMTTPLNQWIARGQGGEYSVMRLRDADALNTTGAFDKMKELAQSYLGRDYDYYFAWDDDKMYCSELVWKLYDRALHVDLCQPSHLRDFNLDNPIVKAKLAQRYGNNVPLDEQVVAPSELHESDQLVEVYFGRLLPSQL